MAWRSWLVLILNFLIAICIFILIGPNLGAKVDLQFINTIYRDVPVWSLIIWSFMIGGLVWIIFMFILGIISWGEKNKLKREVKNLKKEIEALRQLTIEWEEETSEKKLSEKTEDIGEKE